jgi:hypothetical protein
MEKTKELNFNSKGITCKLKTLNSSINHPSSVLFTSSSPRWGS